MIGNTIHSIYMIDDNELIIKSIQVLPCSHLSRLAATALLINQTHSAASQIISDSIGFIEV
jgi:hypothetical protein